MVQAECQVTKLRLDMQKVDMAASRNGVEKWTNISQTKGRKINSILLGMCLTLYYCLMIGTIKTDGVYFLPFQQEFDASATAISSAYSISNGFFFICAPLFGAFFKLTGARTSLVAAACLTFIGTIGTSQATSLPVLIICYSVIKGTGTGLGFLSLFTVSGTSYTHNRALVNNLFGGTSAIFAAIAAPLVQNGFQKYTWHGVMLIQSAILFNTFPIGLLSSGFYNKTSPAIEEMRSRKKIKFRNILSLMTESFDVDMLKDGLFVLYCTGNSFNEMIRVMQNMYLVRYAQSIGISNEESSVFITIYQTSFIGVTLISGYLMSKLSLHAAKTGNKMLVKTSTVIAGTSFLQVIVAFIPVIWETYVAYLIYTLFVGILSGASGSLPISLVVEFFGSKKLSSAMGFRGLFFGVFNLVLPPLIGRLVDMTGSYQPTLYATAVFSLVGASMFVALQVFIDHRHKNTENVKSFD